MVNHGTASNKSLKCQNICYFDCVSYDFHMVCFAWTPKLRTVEMRQFFQCRFSSATTLLHQMEYRVRFPKHWRCYNGCRCLHFFFNIHAGLLSLSCHATSVSSRGLWNAVGYLHGLQRYHCFMHTWDSGQSTWYLALWHFDTKYSRCLVFDTFHDYSIFSLYIEVIPDGSDFGNAWLTRILILSRIALFCLYEYSYWYPSETINYICGLRFFFINSEGACINVCLWIYGPGFQAHMYTVDRGKLSSFGFYWPLVRVTRGLIYYNFCARNAFAEETRWW